MLSSLSRAEVLHLVETRHLKSLSLNPAEVVGTNTTSPDFESTIVSSISAILGVDPRRGEPAIAVVVVVVVLVAVVEEEVVVVVVVAVVV